MKNIKTNKLFDVLMVSVILLAILLAAATFGCKKSEDVTEQNTSEPVITTKIAEITDIQINTKVLEIGESTDITVFVKVYDKSKNIKSVMTVSKGMLDRDFVSLKGDFVIFRYTASKINFTDTGNYTISVSNELQVNGETIDSASTVLYVQVDFGKSSMKVYRQVVDFDKKQIDRYFDENGNLTKEVIYKLHY